MADAAAAHRGGDDRLLRLGGFVGEVPGGEGSALPSRMVEGRTIEGRTIEDQTVEGTSDTESGACFALRAVAESYARRYNRAIAAAAER